MDLEWETGITLQRLLPDLERRFGGDPEWQDFARRLDEHFPQLFAQLFELYGRRYDLYYHLQTLLNSLAQSWIERPPALRALDANREANPTWFQSQRMMGATLYVDLFAGTLRQLQEAVPYFEELGLTYLHLMPVFRSPAGNNDGGYAVSSYRDVHPALGSMEDLSQVAAELREHGISLVLDFIFNHTSHEHEWARRAQGGERRYENYYYIFPDRSEPDRYQPYLRDIFPEQRPGAFTQLPDGRWVWTTFNSFQWDLNYSNPEVFVRMAEEMLFLANRGAEILRLDAVVFAWKSEGTSCENLPQVHTLIRAFNAVARISAPSLLFKSEAIVHPDQVISFISEDQCQLSYNPLLMALLWEALATRDTRLLAHSMAHRFALDPCCAWVNYVRSHDDIGWTFDDGDAAQLGINAFDHRRFLNAFYTGRFPGSFASGVPFQENPLTGDVRVAGTAASLAGLQQAMEHRDEAAIDLSIKRILLLYSVILSIGGIPLLYIGDEVGMLNEFSYLVEPAKAADSRWIHRPRADRERMARRHDTTAVEGRIFSGLLHLIGVRRGCETLSGNVMEVVDSGNGHVFAYVRRHNRRHLLVLANFSEHPQRVAKGVIRVRMGQGALRDIAGGETVQDDDIMLEPYQFLWLVPLPSC